MNPSAARLRRLVGRAVTDFAMIEAGDRILVGLSGGVDSMMLMHQLVLLQRHAPIPFEIAAATVDAGFGGIDHTSLRRDAHRRGWPLEILSAPIAARLNEPPKKKRPCALCSRLRRGLLYGHAQANGYTKLALGHHRDDLCASLLMSLFRGTGLKTMRPNVAADQGRLRVIRPLCFAPKKLLETCARELDFPEIGTCDHAALLDESGDRARIERLLRELEPDFPHLGANMLRSMTDVRTDYLLDRMQWSQPSL